MSCLSQLIRSQTEKRSTTRQWNPKIDSGYKNVLFQQVIFHLRFERGKCLWPWVKIGMLNATA